MLQKIAKNRFGYYELATKPTQDELAAYYQNKYYQEAVGSYEKSYSEEEVSYFANKNAQKKLVLDRLMGGDTDSQSKLLELGCGEGWALKYFRENGWNVTGLDYSSFGCKTQNPDCFDAVIAGDIYQNLEGLMTSGTRFDAVLLDNVLEHVLDPLALLSSCRELLKDGGILVLEVPNDFSTIQEYLLNKGVVTRPYWIADPDHVSYFSKDGLVEICKAAGFSCEFLMADFPIEWNLFNNEVNYVEDGTKGKSCHLSRIQIENFMHAISPEKTVELLRALAELGMGRCISGFFSKSS